MDLTVGVSRWQQQINPKPRARASHEWLAKVIQAPGRRPDRERSRRSGALHRDHHDDGVGKCGQNLHSALGLQGRRPTIQLAFAASRILALAVSVVSDVLRQQVTQLLLGDVESTARVATSGERD
ncbi:MAG TPA: hypothetical protein VGM14_23815, partial [Streptosporangiaceae bacterium]